MKIILLIFFIMTFYSCSNEKKVFWCGDHACVNDNERKLYFKKTMTVEIKKVNNKKNTEDSDTISRIIDKEKILSKEKLKLEKDRIKEEKRLAKQKLKEEKNKIKEEKRLAKKKIKDEKDRIKREKKLAKKELDREKKIKKNTPTNSSVIKINDSNEDFSTLREKVTNRNMFRPFPNINDIPN